MRCGQAIIAAADAAPGEPIRVGVGVHAGETVETAEGFVGSAVNIAARLCAQAKAGELVVSDTVRALTRTYLDVEFEPLGARRLKGVERADRPLPRRSPHGDDAGARPARGAARRRPWLARRRRHRRRRRPGGGRASPWSAGSGASPTAQPSAPPSDAAVADALGGRIAREPSGEPRRPGGLTAAEQALLARVPLDFQPYCRRSSLPDGSLGGSRASAATCSRARPGTVPTRSGTTRSTSRA